MKWKMNDEAVSPVIAVILMVAITVVLAATVFVLVSDIGNNTTGSAPELSFREDQEADTLTVIKAESGLTWASFTVSGCTAPADAESVDAGDQLTACSGRVTVSHDASNTLVYEGTF
jgi:flagellin-like protein